jgi:rhodanese-related sulfurtransferase
VETALLGKRRTLAAKLGLAGVAGLALAMAVMLAGFGVSSAAGGSIFQATLEEPNQRTAEVGTEEIRRILADGSAIVLDSRKYSEYASGHIPGARSAAPEPGAPPEAFIAEVERHVGGDKATALVLYCNGQYCQASRRLSEQLLAAGFTNVRRYQIGIPVWRALGGTTEMELEAVRRVYELDRTAVFLDARPAEEFQAGTLPGAKNLPPDSVEGGTLRRGAGEGALPRDDFNTRIVVFGGDAAQARALAEAVTRSAMQNVAYFPGTFDDLIVGILAHTR